MKNKILSIAFSLMVLLSIFVLPFAYAQDTNNTDDTNQALDENIIVENTDVNITIDEDSNLVIDSDSNETEDDSNETDEVAETEDDSNATTTESLSTEEKEAASNLDNASTSFALKIRLTHLYNSLEEKVTQSELIVAKLKENSIDTTAIETPLASLSLIRDDVKAALDKNQTDDTVVSLFVSSKVDALKLIAEIRKIVKDTVPAELKSQLKDIVKENKRQLKTEDKQRIKDLVLAHNKAVKDRYNKVIADMNATGEIVTAAKIKERIKDKIIEEKQKRIVKIQKAVKQEREKIEKIREDRITKIKETIVKNKEKIDKLKEQIKDKTNNRTADNLSKKEGKDNKGGKQ
ncbi:MAG: hypothetical protein V1824_04825 [archaeon]